MSQLDLFNGPAVLSRGELACTSPLRRMVRRTDPVTSHAAATAALPTAATHRGLALRSLIAAGEQGLTDFELAHVTGVQQTSIGKRRGELVAAGLVSAFEGVTRPAPSGRAAQVWVAL